MRMTVHNGRAGKNGVYSPKHNDRNFDISSAEHIDPERMPGNVYWNWTGRKDVSFEDCEKAFYEEHCRAHLDAVNQRHREQRHPERVRDMDAYRTARQTCPEETLFMIGNRDEHLPPKTLRAICERLKDWEENTVSGLRVLDMALHVDEEGAPHIHMRRAWIYRDENNVESIAQSKALQAAGVPLPHPDKPAGRHNNRKQVFSAMERQGIRRLQSKRSRKTRTGCGDARENGRGKNKTGRSQPAENQRRKNTRAETHPESTGAGTGAGKQEQHTKSHRGRNTGKNGARTDNRQTVGRDEPESPETIAEDAETT